MPNGNGEIEAATSKYWNLFGIKFMPWSEALNRILSDPAGELQRVGQVWSGPDARMASALGGLQIAALERAGVPPQTARLVADVSKQLVGDTPGLRSLVQILLNLTVFGHTLQTMSESYGQVINRGMNKQFHPVWVDPLTYLNAKWRNRENGTGLALPDEYGYDTAQQAYLIRAAQSWLALGDIVQLLHRKEITPDEADKMLGEIGYANPAHRRQLLTVAQRLPDVDTIFNGYYRGTATDRDTVAALTKLGFPETVAGSMLSFSLEQLDPDTVSELYRRGLIDETTARENLKKLRYPVEAADMMLKVSLPLLPVNTILEAWRRKELDAAKTRKALEQHGIRNDTAEKVLATSTRLLDPFDISLAVFRGAVTLDQGLKELEKHGYTKDDALRYMAVRQLLPAPSDLVRFGVREVFTPDIAAKFRLFDEFPAAIVPLGKQIGYTENTLRQYWAAHWDLPAPGQGFDMYHRGIINRDELSMLLKALDVMPFWRDKVIKLADEIIPRRALGTLQDAGLLDREDVIDRLFALGYSREDAALMARGMEYEAASGARDLTKADVLKAYEEGFTDAKFTQSKLTELRYTPRDIAFLMARSEIKRTLNQQATALQATAKEVDAAQDQTSTAIVNAYKVGMLKREDALKQLTALGVPPIVAGYKLQQADLQLHLSLLEAKGAVVQAELEAGVIDTKTAATKLSGLGYSPSGATRIAEQWAAEIEADRTRKAWSEKLPTRSDVTRWLKNGIIAAEEYVAWLRRMGYADETILNYLYEVEYKTEG